RSSSSSMKKLPVTWRGSEVRTAHAASATICGVRLLAISSAPPRRLFTAAVAIVVCGHRLFAATPSALSSSARPSVTRDIPYFAIVQPRCLPAHSGLRLSGGESVSTCAAFEALRCGNAVLARRNELRGVIECMRSNYLIGRPDDGGRARAPALVA